MKKLVALSPNADAGSGQGAHVLPLSPEAFTRWKEFAAWLEPQLGEGGELGRVAGRVFAEFSRGVAAAAFGLSVHDRFRCVAVS